MRFFHAFSSRLELKFGLATYADNEFKYRNAIPSPRRKHCRIMCWRAGGVGAGRAARNWIKFTSQQWIACFWTPRLYYLPKRGASVWLKKRGKLWARGRHQPHNNPVGFIRELLHE